ncbi:hypothetical protein SAMN02745751_02726 [Dethiosulfatibacter aminovorans DSM 17477]|uniref:Uncharacterized protein n=1 Tax=Dethiosulfatibacter aminovorans DSM 17477 TaxID=1121476 RepID=A0A1M6JVV3_9FIRM|nr:hypothetical protein [Dethiosulfatibacter aminovorans]SHJ50821.1 hypothetical protein SAMN02745751_02726 [Dethiosulfatibacter aminovorans DSM 17477]
MKNKKDYFDLIDDNDYSDFILKKEKIKKNRKIKSEKTRENTSFPKRKKRKPLDDPDLEGGY